MAYNAISCIGILDFQIDAINVTFSLANVITFTRYVHDVRLPNKT